MKTRWALLAPLARTPAVVPGVYTALAVLGMVVALAVQASILAGEGITALPALAASLLAIAAGLIAAKAWYAVLHPDESIIRGGWAVDGFLVVAPVVAVVAIHALELPMGVVLDAATPGLFFAVALGRVGCFVTGCCAGRCTSSRLGIWSSDRRVGARRIPTQLLEAVAGVAIGAVSSLLVLGHALPVHGLTFVVAFAAYTVVRQVLLRLRAERRRSARTVPLTAGAAAAVLIAVAVMSTVERSEPPSHTAGASGVLGDAGSPASSGSFPG
ncbi:MAG: prolipoprotein diacylglyceryl transferase family protein [Chloroflexota bacterium]